MPGQKGFQTTKRDYLLTAPLRPSVYSIAATYLCSRFNSHLLRNLLYEKHQELMQHECEKSKKPNERQTHNK